MANPATAWVWPGAGLAPVFEPTGAHGLFRCAEGEEGPIMPHTGCGTVLIACLTAAWERAGGAEEGGRAINVDAWTPFRRKTTC